MLTSLKSQKFRERGENQKQEGIGAALDNLLGTFWALVLYPTELNKAESKGVTWYCYTHQTHI